MSTFEIKTLRHAIMICMQGRLDILNYFGDNGFLTKIQDGGHCHVEQHRMSLKYDVR